MQILSSSTLDMTDIQNLLKVDFNDESKASVWNITAADEPPRMGTTWVGQWINNSRLNLLYR